jgi:hypothetical protein
MSALDGNLLATFLTLKRFLPGMKERRRGTPQDVAGGAVLA